MTHATPPPPDFRGPSALDMMTEFEKRYGEVIYKRREELRMQLAVVAGIQSPEAYAVHDELDSITNFEPELHRLIMAFVAEAVKPLQDTLAGMAMRYPLLSAIFSVDAPR